MIIIQANTGMTYEAFGPFRQYENGVAKSVLHYFAYAEKKWAFLDSLDGFCALGAAMDFNWPDALEATA